MPREWLLDLLSATAAQPTTSAGARDDMSGDLGVAELAARYHRRPSTVRGWLERGMFPGAFKLRGRDWRATAAGIEHFDATERQRGSGETGSKPARSRARSVDLSAWRTERSAS